MSEGGDKVSEVDVEAAQLVATGQLDLAFSVMEMMALRTLPADPDALKSLMGACGRCGSTIRATQLISIMKAQHLQMDSEMHSSYLTAFSVGNEIRPDEPIQSPLTNVPMNSYNPNAPPKLKWFARPRSANIAGFSAHSVETSFLSESDNSSSGAPSSNDYGHNSYLRHSSGLSKRHIKHESLRTTENVDRHLAIGDSLIDYVYSGLKIDDKGDTCPQCSTFVKVDQITMGWSMCSFTEYRTKCPFCEHLFVPRFVVQSDSADFTGTQGAGTPLYCDFFSPWVLRRELHLLTSGGDDLDNIIDPEWRRGNGDKAKLWWNMIVLFRRQKLPITFLLQGSFRDRLIMPMP